ncbi:MAG TPA: DNA internalization-related competence protein ComEC/Rec2, partial [Gammaproteobacteria bacterium]|nr:DNA internalization-related competence protein ComEC/Rec2 [Gammaproteobacteria bacterium]
SLGFDNDSSCVLQVATENKRLLLPGDIEKTAEKILISNPATNLKADLLIAPHHGSKTSGQTAFIRRVQPQYVLYAVGYRNRYHFPHPSVVQSYRDFGVIQYDTAREGMIQFHVAKQTLFPITFYRRSQAHYWND